MELFEYIKSQLPQMPNSAIMKQMGASEELIDYVKETPWNTNWNVIGSIAGSGGGGGAEVWLVGDTYADEDGHRAFGLHGSEAHLTELFTNPTNYDISLNDTELPYYRLEADTDRVWRDTYSSADNTKVLYVYENEIGIGAECWFMDIATAPTSVEVSVKAK